MFIKERAKIPEKSLEEAKNLIGAETEPVQRRYSVEYDSILMVSLMETEHCGRACEECFHYPKSPYCGFREGTIKYWIKGEGECNGCGWCCQGRKCPHLYPIKPEVYRCDIYEKRPQSCIDFPTIKDFLENNVPNQCSYILKSSR